jgi:hypothetical protein
MCPRNFWNAYVTTGAYQEGDIAFTQLIETDSLYTEDNPTESQFVKTTNGTSILDGGPPQYDVPGHINSNVTNYHYIVMIHDNPPEWAPPSDSPRSSLDNVMKRVSRTDDFQLYLMYKPSSENSIWVTLCKLNWFWGGTASKNPEGIWFLVDGSDSYSPNPTGFDDTELPQWEDCYDNLQMTQK